MILRMVLVSILCGMTVAIALAENTKRSMSQRTFLENVYRCLGDISQPRVPKLVTSWLRHAHDRHGSKEAWSASPLSCHLVQTARWPILETPCPALVKLSQWSENMKGSMFCLLVELLVLKEPFSTGGFKCSIFPRQSIGVIYTEICAAYGVVSWRVLVVCSFPNTFLQHFIFTSVFVPTTPTLKTSHSHTCLNPLTLTPNPRSESPWVVSNARETL